MHILIERTPCVHTVHTRTVFNKKGLNFNALTSYAKFVYILQVLEVICEPWFRKCSFEISMGCYMEIIRHGTVENTISRLFKPERTIGLGFSKFLLFSCFSVGVSGAWNIKCAFIYKFFYNILILFPFRLRATACVRFHLRTQTYYIYL